MIGSLNYNFWISMRDPFFQKNILITGGSGSFGRQFVRHVLTHHQPAKVVIFSRDEWKQWEMQQAQGVFTDHRMRYFLGDVRDPNRLLRAFNEIDIVIHAAALKQVPAAEYNPSEFVQTNVTGSMNVIDAAVDCGVERVIALSTDKAVNPINLYGATKLCAEKLFLAAESYVGSRGKPIFGVVRYGNVLMSRGSVIALWQRQVEQGEREISLTDSSMTRFWLTLQQAVTFVVRAVAESKGGEIFIPRLPSMRLIDLLSAVAPGVATKILGIREGEKRHEVLIPAEEALKVAAWQSHFCIYGRNTQERLARAKQQGAQLVDSSFSYTSENNGQWLKVAECQAILKEASKD